MDIAPTALSLMGVADTGMNGIALPDAQLSPSRTNVSQARSLSARLVPVVKSLAQESKDELAAGK